MNDPKRPNANLLLLCVACLLLEHMLAESGWPKVYSYGFILYNSHLRILATLKEFKLSSKLCLHLKDSLGEFLKSINASNMLDFYYLKIGQKSLRNHFIFILYNIGVYIDIVTLNYC